MAPLARAPIAPLLAALLLAACSNDPVTPPDGGAPDAGHTDAGMDAGPDAGMPDAGNGDAGVDAGPSCHPTFPAQGTFLTLDPIKTHATVLLPDGGPYAHLSAGVGGLDISNLTVTSGDGTVEVDLDQSVMDPQFRFGDGLGYGEFSIPVTSANQTLPAVHTVPLPAIGETMVDAGSVTSGGLTLTFAANTAFAIDTLIYNSAPSQEFRAAEIPIALAPVDASLGFEHVYGIGPLETTFCPAAQLSVANTFGWTAGTKVDVYGFANAVQGSVPFATWFVISTGAVSSDGTTINTDASGGLPVLTTLAIRRH